MVITEVGMFPKGKRDDLTDTVSMGLRWLRDVGMLQLAPERLAEVEEFEAVRAHAAGGAAVSGVGRIYALD